MIENDTIKAGLDLLADLDWIEAQEGGNRRTPERQVRHQSEVGPMSYLARLKTLLHERPLPQELTKPTKGASVSFVSDQGSRFCAGEDADAIEERAGLAAD